MTLNEYIEKLVTLQQAGHGELEVVDAYDEQVSEPTMDNEAGSPAIIICDKA